RRDHLDRRRGEGAHRRDRARARCDEAVYRHRLAAPPAGGAAAPRQDFSYRKPTFNTTWKCATLPSAMWPRVWVTSNHSRLRRVWPAVETALRMASSMLVDDEPTSSVTAY